MAQFTTVDENGTVTWGTERGEARYPRPTPGQVGSVLAPDGFTWVWLREQEERWGDQLRIMRGAT